MIPRVAVTGVSGHVGMGMILGLRSGPSPIWILGLDCYDDCVGFHIADSAAQVPLACDPAYLSHLIELLKVHNVDLLLPGVDAELSILAAHREEIKQRSGCEILVESMELISVLKDKYRTSRFLRETGVPAPLTLPGDSTNPSSRLGFPLIVKPRVGNGSKGVRVIRSPAELSALSSGPDLCYQQYLDGDEYTCGLLFDRQGRLCDSIALKRQLKEGATSEARVVTDSRLDRLFETFADAIKPVGPMNLQCRMTDSGEPHIFEVNPRFSGSTSMQVKAGFNGPFRMVNHYLLAQPIEKSVVQRFAFLRYSTELVMDTSGRVCM